MELPGLVGVRIGFIIDFKGFVGCLEDLRGSMNDTRNQLDFCCF